MEINVLKLGERINDIDLLINDYEVLYLNLYNELNSIDANWRDTRSVMFNKRISKEKLAVKNYIDEMNEVKNIYRYIIDSYGELGKKVYYKEKSGENIIKSINRDIEKIDKIVNMYSSLDISFLGEEKEIIEKEIVTIENIRKRAVKLKDLYMDLIDRIEEIENVLVNKISKIKVDVVKETDINSYIGD